MTIFAGVDIDQFWAHAINFCIRHLFAMAKYCIFCGKPPSEKNKEHVIPRWLIRMTGDENRVINLGFKKSRDKIGNLRQFAFDQFTFPACEVCNSNYSELESRAQTVMRKILHRAPVRGDELSEFLDWFDKVRVGLWLGFQQLEKNFLDIEPNFHIEKRIRQYDRMLMVSYSDESRLRLNFAGADSVSFAYTPAAFSLTVNNVHFTNISYSYLFSRRIGFPYPDQLYFLPDRDELTCNICKGRSRVMLPLIKKHIPQAGIRLYQPMFPQNLASAKSDEYDEPYVKANSYEHAAGVGAIFMQPDLTSPLSKIDEEQEVLLDSGVVHADDELTIKNLIHICEWQDWLSESQVSIEKLTSDQKKYVKSIQRFSRRMNDVLIQHHRRLLQARGY